MSSCIIITILSLLLVSPCATSLSFNFTHFTPNDHNITYEVDAHSANNGIELTRNQQNLDSLDSMGRATYNERPEPLHLWDRASRNLTNFTTTFSFVINSMNEPTYADGLAFFLRSNGSRMPDNSSLGGGNMGLTTYDEQMFNSTNNPFVAVEFDIFQNTRWDPPCNNTVNGNCNHVGIDVNSIQSVTSVQWWSDVSIRQGMEREATITYDSSSITLSVVFTGYRNGTNITQNISHVIDLRDYLPEFVTIGFTAATGAGGALHTINSWSFSSTPVVNVNVTDSWTVTPNEGNRNETGSRAINSGNNNIRLIIGLAVGLPVFLVIIFGLVIYFFLKNRKRMMNEVDESVDDVSFGYEFDQGTGPKKFFYHDLNRATNNFAEQEKLGEGGFGGVYKGYLKETDSYIAVKRVSKDSNQGIKEYVSEVKIISSLRHRNLVQLLGWCHEKKELLLVYELMTNGSLDFHLFKGKSILNWETRFKIAQGLASALLYLHEEWEQCVVHRDIKSSNIMLDEKFNAKLGDFGLARLVDHEKGSQTTVLAGTMGYMAPECGLTGKSSKETDVFSFGVVVLEIASGRRAIDPKAELSRIHLVNWIWNLYGMGNILKASDPQLGLEFNSREMEQLMIVGLWCAHPDSDMRPSIRQAIQVLNFEAPLPDLPVRMPVPMYCVPSQDMYSTTYGSSYTGSSVSTENAKSSNFTASSTEGSSPSIPLMYST